jgi:hypothetical protein
MALCLRGFGRRWRIGLDVRRLAATFSPLAALEHTAQDSPREHQGETKYYNRAAYVQQALRWVVGTREQGRVRCERRARSVGSL